MLLYLDRSPFGYWSLRVCNNGGEACNINRVYSNDIALTSVKDNKMYGDVGLSSRTAKSKKTSRDDGIKQFSIQPHLTYLFT